MNFRYDINGLRAIAVLAVVFFHFKPTWVPGGFAGVDVFFVISGFLMTSIIFRGLEEHNFNLLKFYLARARRIVPALAALCLALLIFGWFYLTPIDYQLLTKHILSSMSFLSNIIYWSEAGYFDVASHDKWLLHTWSLSAEWQFYILYPVILVVLKRFLSLVQLKQLVVVGTILGFGLSVVATMKWPISSYYLLPTRAWEMMVGGVAYLYPWIISDIKKKLTNFIGLTLILATYVFAYSEIPWPGYFALLPVLGTYLVIVANQQSSLITNNIVFQLIGKWSYSIYLWHWPVVVFGSYFSIEYWLLYGLAISIALGFISFNFVERFNIKGGYIVLTMIFSCLFSSFAYIKISKLIEYRKDAPEFYLGHNAIQNGQRYFLDLRIDHTLNSEENELDFIGIGDSNLTHYGYGIANSKGLSIKISAAGSCIPFIDYTRKPYAKWMNDVWLNRCSKIYKIIEDYEYTDVILSAVLIPSELICTTNECDIEPSKLAYNEIQRNQIKKLSTIIGEKRILNIIGLVPAPNVSLVKCSNQTYLSQECRGDVFTESDSVRILANKELELLSLELENVNFINPFDAICDKENKCRTIENGKNLFFDAGHLSGYGSLKIWAYIENNLRSGASVNLR
ncbi:acyltransferase family protein [uncultured Vibrio sp.]|uniref:acyltransferase family protein n=1 Tax=uncultured Vibrio sp. TaxID=114054 RepID=UPI0025F4AE5B|nr:acyltransferase family protein [uncultured Vibrio sp.]